MSRPALLFLAMALSGCATTPSPTALEAADQLRRAGRNAEAYDAYASALCETPGDLDAARYFVELWNELGRPGRPQTRLEGCVLEPVVDAFVDGLVAGALGEVEEAHGNLKRAEADAPVAARGEIAYRRGLLDLGRERADLGQAHLERAAALSPQRPEIRLALAQAQIDQGAYAAGIDVLRGLLSIETDRHELTRARRILRNAVKRAEPALDAGTERQVNELLAGLEGGESSPEALAASQALVSKQEHPRVLTVAALVALRRGLDLDAAQLLERAARLNPIDPEPMRVLGASRHAAERPADAFSPLREAFHRDPFDVTIARMLASAANAIGETKVARDTYRALARLEPADPENHLWLARLERKLGRAGVARTIADFAVEKAPTHVALLLELASIEAELALSAPTAAEREAARGRTHVAVERLLTVAPGHPGAEAILASLEQGAVAP